MIRYFVSFMYQGSGGIGVGNMEVTLPRPITGMQDIPQITEILRRDGFDNPTVMSFCRFADTNHNARKGGGAR